MLHVCGRAWAHGVFLAGADETQLPSSTDVLLPPAAATAAAEGPLRAEVCLAGASVVRKSMQSAHGPKATLTATLALTPRVL